MHCAPIITLHEFVVLLEAETCNIRAHNARVWYPISDLLHLRNDVLIGFAYIARGENLGFYKNLYACVQKRELCSYIYPTLID